MDRDNATAHSIFAYLILSGAVLYAYLCIPRALLAFIAPSSELHLTRGFIDQTLAYVGVLIGVYAFAVIRGSEWLRRLSRAWWHLEFLIRSCEAALLYRFGIGYSPLVLYHVDRVSVRLAVTQGWMFLLAVTTTCAGAEWVFHRVPTPPESHRRTFPGRLALILAIAFAARSVFVLHRERGRLPQDFAVTSLAENIYTYMRTNRALERLTLTAAEHTRLENIGIRFHGDHTSIRWPRQRHNLITIYLEGFQANFTQPGGDVYPGLSPNLDRFAREGRFFGRFYNAVTPTINSLVSSQCGILSRVENDDLEIDRGYTRNLTCLSDVLHLAGYYQVFLGGADSSFSGKRLFLDAHHYDEVWGWERWGRTTAYTGNSWGLQDTDLVREAIARLPQLRAREPFHLTLLTVNTHQPGFVAPDCPTYLAGRLMLNAIHCTDYAIGKLIEALKVGGYLDNTVVLIMGDHMMFPSPESAAALGPASAGWFGPVFMALHQLPSDARSRSEADTAAGYTPDFAPTALDALGFTPIPEFPVGHTLLDAQRETRVLVAPRFQVVDGRMIPERPDLTDTCSEEMVAEAVLDEGARAFGDCERDKIIDLIDQSLLAPVGPLLDRRTTPDAHRALDAPGTR